MKKILYYVLLAVLITSCSKESIIDDNNDNQTYNLEGRWYISGSTLGYINQQDSGRYNYNDKVLGYQEFTFKLIPGEENYYSVYAREITLKQRENEHEEQYINRLVSGDYSADELYMTENEKITNWFISGKDIWVPWEERKYKGLQLGKMVKWSNNQFTMAAVCQDIFSWGIPYNSVNFPYYFTLKRIQ